MGWKPRQSFRYIAIADALFPLHHQQAPKPAWLKDLAVIDIGIYCRSYRQKRTSFAGAGDGAICGALTFSIYYQSPHILTLLRPPG
jgi:hypothetical protein